MSEAERPASAGDGTTGAEKTVARLDSYPQEQHVAGINAARVRRGRLDLTTQLAIEAVEYERAPRYPGRTVNRRIVCADGYVVSVQASASHYAHDSTGGRAPYWEMDPVVAYPFTTFEVGNPSAEPEPADSWDRYESGGVWAWVPPQLVAELLDAHGGAVAWEGAQTP